MAPVAQGGLGQKVGTEVPPRIPNKDPYIYQAERQIVTHTYTKYYIVFINEKKTYSEHS